MINKKIIVPYQGQGSVSGAICGAVVALWRLGGESPLRTLVTGTVSRTARVSAARRNPKEAAGKLPARRTGTACEATTSGRGGMKIQSPIVTRKVWKYMRRVYGRKVARLTLGDLSICLVLPTP